MQEIFKKIEEEQKITEKIEKGQRRNNLLIFGIDLDIANE